MSASSAAFPRGAAAKDLYVINKNARFLNNGSYGCPPRAMLEAKYRHSLAIDANVDLFMRFQAEPLMERIRRTVAEEVLNLGSDGAKNVFLVENATVAINTLALSIAFAHATRANSNGDNERRRLRVQLLNVMYPSARNAFIRIAEAMSDQIEIVELNISLAMIQDEALLVQTMVDHGSKCDVVIFDYVGWAPAFIWPVDLIIDGIRAVSPSTYILVDAAHAIGMIPLDLSNFRGDALLSNFHKWFSVPKSAAFLYCSDRLLGDLHPAATGNFFHKGTGKEFFWIGTRDYTSFMCIPDALAFRRDVLGGETSIMEYTRTVALAGARRAAEVWGTEVFVNDPRRLGAIVNVRLPCDDEALANRVVSAMLHEDGSYFPVMTSEGKCFARFSAQVFNTVDEFEWIAREFVRRCAALENSVGGDFVTATSMYVSPDAPEPSDD